MDTPLKLHVCGTEQIVFVILFSFEFGAAAAIPSWFMHSTNNVLLYYTLTIIHTMCASSAGASVWCVPCTQVHTKYNTPEESLFVWFILVHSIYVYWIYAQVKYYTHIYIEKLFMKNSKVYFVMFLGYYGECVCIYVIFYAVYTYIRRVQKHGMFLCE